MFSNLAFESASALVNTAFGGFFDLTLKAELESENVELIADDGEKECNECAEKERCDGRGIEIAAHALFCDGRAINGKKDG